MSEGWAHTPGGERVALESWTVTMTSPPQPPLYGLAFEPVSLDQAYESVAKMTLKPEDAAHLAILLGEQTCTLEIRHDLNPHRRRVQGWRSRVRRWRDIIAFDWARLLRRDPLRELVVTIPDAKLESVSVAE